MISLLEKLGHNDWVISGLSGCLLALLVYLSIFQNLGQLVYDSGQRLLAKNAAKDVVVVEIDPATVQRLGRPSFWSYDVYANVLQKINPHARAIGLTVPLPHPQRAPIVEQLHSLSLFYANANPLIVLPDELQSLQALINQVATLRRIAKNDKPALKQLQRFYQQSALHNDLPQALTQLEDQLNAILDEVDSNTRLAMQLQTSERVVLPLALQLQQHGNADVLIQAQYPQPNVVGDHFDRRMIAQPPQAQAFDLPAAPFQEAAWALGGLLPQPLPDVRNLPLVVRVGNLYVPQLVLLLAAKAQDLRPSDILVRLEYGVQVGDWWVNTNQHLYMQPYFYPYGVTKVSLLDILDKHVDPSFWQDKLVLIGASHTPYAFEYQTPVGRLSEVMVHAHMLSNLMQRDFFYTPNWAWIVQIVILALVFAYLGEALHRLPPLFAALSTLGLLLLLGIVGMLLLQQGWHINLLLPALWLSLGHLALVAKRMILAYRDAFRLHPDAVESNRLLGLAFQGQGQLDMAFAKFRLCPPDDAILGLLYNLALDYEQHRQTSRAASVYRYILSHVNQFRDVNKRLEKLNRLRRPPLRRSNTSLSDWLLEDSGEKPLLGRYQIEKQLGKGAMGIVYLGKDPKLNRLVAIKTLALSQEFEADELEEATTRFFREAAAAGRLDHPHIVSIYDAGEEQDVAYISMEFFKGGNLVPYTQNDNLLPIEKVLDIGMRIAEALDYAHRQGVVHRDIKPANIMYNPASGCIKITDFGIARITDNHKTKTGVILGTPSYMSPEQLAGKLLDGRTDLFSLGVMLYQLLAGKLPFSAETMATLMFRIANEPHPNIQIQRPDLPDCVAAIINTALAKSADARYQTGLAFADVLRTCHEAIVSTRATEGAE